jgi:hypothetical protein
VDEDPLLIAAAGRMATLKGLRAARWRQCYKTIALRHWAFVKAIKRLDSPKLSYVERRKMIDAEAKKHFKLIAKDWVATRRELTAIEVKVIRVCQTKGARREWVRTRCKKHVLAKAQREAARLRRPAS